MLRAWLTSAVVTHKHVHIIKVSAGMLNFSWNPPLSAQFPAASGLNTDTQTLRGLQFG